MKSRRITMIVVAAVAMTLTACSPRQPATEPTPRLRLEVTSPSSGGPITEPTVSVSGIISEVNATVRVNDIEVEVGEDGGFITDVPVAYGSSRISLVAEAEGFQSARRTVNVSRVLTLDVGSPESNTATTQRRITVSGQVSDPAADVRVAGSSVAVGEDGRFSTPLDIHYALTIIPVSAEIAGVEPVSKNITITLN